MHRPGSFDGDRPWLRIGIISFGQSFEKGVWYTEEKIKGGPMWIRTW